MTSFVWSWGMDLVLPKTEPPLSLVVQVVAARVCVIWTICTLVKTAALDI